MKIVWGRPSLTTCSLGYIYTLAGPPGDAAAKIRLLLSHFWKLSSIPKIRANSKITSQVSIHQYIYSQTLSPQDFQWQSKTKKKKTQTTGLFCLCWRKTFSPLRELMPSWKVNTRVFLTRQILFFFFFAKMWFKDCSSVLYFGSVFCKPATLGRVRRWKASELSAMLVSSLAVVRRYRKKIWFLDHSLKVQGIMAECRVMGNPNITTGQEAWHSVPSLSPFSLLFSPGSQPTGWCCPHLRWTPPA